MNTKATRPEPTATDWARLAAYIDGEGAVLLNRYRDGRHNRMDMWLRLTVVNTDPRLPMWIFNTFGVGRFTISDKCRKSTHRQAYRWQCSGKAAEGILRACYQFFIIKREHADIALAYRETIGTCGMSVSLEIREERERLRQALHALKRVTPLFDATPTLCGYQGTPRKRGPKPKSAELDNSSPIGEIVQ